MSDVVLVHGSTQTPAGFWRLSAAQHGHRALPVDVPSAGAHSSSAYAELLAGRLEATHQVWLAAAVADYTGARSLLAEVQAEPTAVFCHEWLGVDPTSDPVLATYFLLHDANLATLQAALPTVARCDLSTVYAEIPPIDPARRPSTYLLPTADRALTHAGMLRMARNRLHIEPIEMPGGHNNYVAYPEPIADAIDQATRPR